MCWRPVRVSAAILVVYFLPPYVCLSIAVADSNGKRPAWSICFLCCSNLYDVFCAIRDDELEHVKTMVACSDNTISADIQVSSHEFDI